ncbi:MAG: excinuclease ABC subunit UvrA [Zetaproteobacteria bacterium]|nr:excinuclease ABC subunit UvrA [Zetaproteobacteria bacterium]
MTQKKMKSSLYCELKGVSTHNLASIDVRIPLYAFTTVSGVSGSGKSSLVFDTLYAESYRRYLESLSSFARQYLQALPKPKVKEVLNLPPAIAVRQSRKGTGNRSTVGTITEVNDLLQLLFQHLSQTRCTLCHAWLKVTQPGALARELIAQYTGNVLVIAAGVRHWEKMKPEEVVQWLLSQGYRRYLDVSGKMHKLDQMSVEKKSFFLGSILLDRFTLSAENEGRLEQSLRTAAAFGRGSFMLSLDGMQSWQEHFDRLLCGPCQKEYRAPTPALFSFNHPLGACKVCQGYGQELALDWEKILPDKEKSLLKGAIAPFEFSDHRRFQAAFAEAFAKRNYSVHKKLSLYTAAQLNWLKSGDGQKFKGIEGYFAWLDQKKHRPHYRIHRMRYSKYIRCRSCHGERLHEDCRAYLLRGKDFLAWQKLSLDRLVEEVTALDVNVFSEGLEKTMIEVVAEAREDLLSRIRFLRQVGLGYLSLQRASATLSGGELQRIHLARCLGSRMTETLYCLDEPSAGLHAQDRDNLLSLILELRDRGNTVVCVEHDRQFFKKSDHLIEIGPEAGHTGGKLMYAGPPSCRDIPHELDLSNSALVEHGQPWVHLKGACLHNLKNIHCAIPLGCFTAVCGVSGSGKSTLILSTLVPLWQARLAGKSIDVETEPLGELSFSAEGGDWDCVHVSQAPLARSSRSNIATYMKVYDRIRRHFANQDKALALGLSPSAFSFNVPGGRCETCAGLGQVTEDLSFLGEMDVLCPDCEGNRFSAEVLSVTVEGCSLIEVLNMTVAQVGDFFWFDPKIKELLKPLISLGLGYLPIGRSTSTLSGGESQRLKLAPTLSAKKHRKTCFVFDEPTTGLSDTDVERLISIFRFLCERGHTVVVVEHHLDVIRFADYVIEVGPGASVQGGDIVYQGAPQGLKNVRSSATAPYLVFS